MSEAEQREIERFLEQRDLPASVRAGLEAVLAGLRAQAASVSGSVSVVGDARIEGPVVGTVVGVAIFGRDPGVEERRRLGWYLQCLAARLQRLPLRGLDERLDEGQGVALPDVYVTLATHSRVEVARGTDARQFLVDDGSSPPRRLKPEHDPELVLPDQARFVNWTFYESPGGHPPPDEAAVSRALLATEAAGSHRRLVLLGEPGGGKSTFLRHLAWTLAGNGLLAEPERRTLAGFGNVPLLPVLLPVKKLARALAAGGPVEGVALGALAAEIGEYGGQGVEDLLREALHRGTALLLLDGLDEVPLEPIAGQTVDRRQALKAISELAEAHARAPIVLTCRVRAFDEGLRRALGWPVETLAPFTLGQVRHFARAWFQELHAKGQMSGEAAGRAGTDLVDGVLPSPKLREMAGSPLLLTLMALVLYRSGRLPRDRPRLYEEFLGLMLDRWDKVREGESLADAIGRPDWDSSWVRPVLDALSFEAHAGATSEDGRGRLERARVRDALTVTFERAGLAAPGESARRCLVYFDERAGLLVPEGDGSSYAFSHLTLEEHCAGRHLLLGADAVRQVMRVRHDDRWHEPILLGLGVIQEQNWERVEKVLGVLVDVDEDGAAKPPLVRQKDLLHAAAIGAERDWGRLRAQGVAVDRIQAELKTGLVELLADRGQPLPIKERIRAGHFLGDLCDPRYPVTIDGWREQVRRAVEGEAGYFCRVEPGTYVIGSDDDDRDAAEEEKPAHPVTFDQRFWIGRYPVTNAQWTAWVAQGGRRSWLADEPQWSRPSQAVVAVIWDMAREFCAWLERELRDSVPEGFAVRLPQETEWEAAARGRDRRRYPWGDWQEDRAATTDDVPARGERASTPVGCYPAGAAPCGALDMAGGVWEWTEDEWRSYPGARKAFHEAGWRVLRGGSVRLDRHGSRCGARGRVRPDGGVGRDVGFRLVVASRLAPSS